MTLLSDIGAALTGSVPTDGSAAWVGNQNANNYNLGGVSNLTAGTVTANYVSATNASIGALASGLNANNQAINGVGSLEVNGSTNLYGGLSVDAGAANFFAGLSVDAGQFTAWGGAVFEGQFYCVGAADIGGGGVVYSGLPSNPVVAIGFGWDGNAIAAYVNGQDVGYIPPIGLLDRLAARLAQLEARIAELEDELSRVH